MVEIVCEVEKLLHMNLAWTETSIELEKLEINTKHKSSGIWCNIKFGDRSTVYNSALVDTLLDVQPLGKIIIV